MNAVLIFLFRLSVFLNSRRVPLVPRLITYVIRFVFGAWLPATVNAGRNLILGYGGMSIVIHHQVVLGDNCHIDQCVTIGGATKKQGVPVLGNNVYIGAGAKVLGPIVIGDDVVIGANAVVLSSIPAGSVAVGVPAKVVKTGIRKEYYIR